MTVADTFFKQFEILADAPNAVPKLRELILQLAVRGKLVSQDPNDEPASVLLEKIQNQKKDVVIKKSKQPDEENYSLGNLPDSWMWSNLYSIGIINPRNNFLDEESASFIPMNLVPQTLGGKLRWDVKKWGDIKKGFTHFADGDVVLAKITPCFQNGKAAVMRGLENGIGAGTTELLVFRPTKDLICPEYVLIHFKSPIFVDNAIPRLTGTAGQKRVPTDYFVYSPFPLPPLNEQKRIVEKVDKLMEWCDRLEKQQQQRRETCINLNRVALTQLTTAKTTDEFSDRWQKVRDNFDLLYSLPENVSQLRQSILQLAVVGKLVKQDPNDEPASILLARTKEYLT